MGDQAKAAGISDAAVQAKTGKTWSEWFAILDQAGAAAWPHKEIATYLYEKCSCPNWWCQMVTVGYEQARGLRVKHQTATGFVANVSKTVGVPVADLFAAWHNPRQLAKWLPDGKKMTIRKATENKSLRATWVDSTTSLEVLFWSKGASKSQVVVQHSKLASADEVTGLKAYWANALLSLKAILEGVGGDSKPANDSAASKARGLRKRKSSRSPRLS